MALKTLAACLCVLLLFSACSNVNERSLQETHELRAKLDNVHVGQIVRDIYASRDFRPVWVARGQKLPSLQQVLELIGTRSDGLHPEAFDVPALQQKATAERIDDPLQFDIDVTSALAKYAAALAREDADVKKELIEAIESGSITGLRDRLAPKHPEYAALRNALQDASETDREQIEVNLNRWRKLPDDLGERHIRVNVPAFRLEVHDGDQIPLTMNVVVGANNTKTPLFSSEMNVVAFSPYWNIPESILKKETLPKIQKDPEYANRQHYEVVRVSGKHVEVLDPDDIDWSTVDPSKIQLRQRPGALNSLGRVKFLFPNEYDVYLHDTPSVKLFAKAMRNLSHGCVRIEKPEELAQYLLHDQGEWTPERIHAAMRSDDERQVALEHPVPVHLLYFTAWVDGDGKLHLEKDIYGYDTH